MTDSAAGKVFGQQQEVTFLRRYTPSLVGHLMFSRVTGPDMVALKVAAILHEVATALEEPTARFVLETDGREVRYQGENPAGEAIYRRMQEGR